MGVASSSTRVEVPGERAEAGPARPAPGEAPLGAPAPTPPLDGPPSLRRESPGSDREEAESFQGWLRSGSEASTRPNSLESKRSPSMSQSQADTHTTGAGGGSGSGQWMTTRPSADTPLPQSHGGHDESSKGAAAHGDGHASAPRGSRSSSGTVGHLSSPPASVRSSFALERVSLQLNRESMEAFQQAAGPAAAPGEQAQGDMLQPAGPAITLDMLATLLGSPSPELTQRYGLLAVLPAQTPAPACMLQRLWRADARGVSATLAALSSKGVVNMAQLPDGRVWCLPQAQQLQLLQAACRDSLPAFHRRLVDAYAAELAPGAGGLAALPDDGYIALNLGHHLVGAGRLADLRALLLDPAWLGRRLAAAGTAAVVGDFRRYLLAASGAGGDPDVKLVLEAFQMSAVQAQAHPEAAGIVRCLLAGRLMAAALSPELQGWLAEQRALMAEDAAAAAAAGLPRSLQPQTPSLDQAGGLQRLVLRGHSGPVTKVLLAPSGTDAITASADGTARVWDLEIGDCVLVLEGHAGPITGLAITADSSLLLSSSEDGTVRAFELERGQCLRVLAGHSGRVNAVACDPAGRFVVTAGEDGTARVWELTSGRAIHVLKTGAAPEQGGALCVALSPCTRFALVGGAGHVAHMFDVVTGKVMGVLAGHTNWVVAVHFSRSGRKAVTASHDGTARVWDLQKGTCRHVLEGHQSRLNALALSEDGKTAATASDDGSTRVWDVATGACRKVLKGHTAWVTDAALSPAHDKVLSASGDGTAIAYSLDSGEVVQVLEGHSGAVLSAALTRKGRFAVTGGEDGTVRVFDFTTPSTATPKWHEGRIHCLAARDGIAVATTGDDCAARLWEMESGEFRGLLTGHRTPIRWASFSRDGARLVTASADRMVRVWEGTACVLTIPAHQGSRMKSFACSADASTAVACLFDSTVTLWDLGTGQPSVVLQKWGERDSQKGHSSAVNEVLMSGDGQTVVTLSKDCTARVWSAESGACLHVLSGHSEQIVKGVISDGAHLLATFSYDDTVRVWSLETGLCIRDFSMQAPISSLALSPDGRVLAVALSDNSLWVCSPQGDAPPKLWKGHTGEITGLSFSADGMLLASCALDSTVRLWNAGSGALEALFVSDSNPACCHVDSTTDTVVVGTCRGVVHFLR